MPDRQTPRRLSALTSGALVLVLAPLVWPASRPEVKDESAASRPFAWNRDSLWNALEAGFAQHRVDGCSTGLDPQRATASLDSALVRLGTERVQEDQFKYRIEVDTASGIPATGLRSSTLVNVSRGFFGAFGTSVVARREFRPLDFENGRVMMVNQSFARHVFGGLNPIGQRIRIVGGEISTYAGDTWYEVVGMVSDFGWQLPRPQEQSAMYLPALVAPAGRAGASPCVCAVRKRSQSVYALSPPRSIQPSG
jgi:hypothetical protein